MNYKGKHDRTVLFVVAAVLTAIVTIIVLTTAASARMMHQNPAEDFIYCLTTEVELT